MRDPRTLAKQWDQQSATAQSGGSKSLENAAGRPASRTPTVLDCVGKRNPNAKMPSPVGRCPSGIRGSGRTRRCVTRVHELQNRRGWCRGRSFSSVLHGGALNFVANYASGWLRLLLVSYMPAKQRCKVLTQDIEGLQLTWLPGDARTLPIWSVIAGPPAKRWLKAAGGGFYHLLCLASATQSRREAAV